MPHAARRSFVIRSPAFTGALCALGAQSTAFSQSTALVSETDPQAVALGHKADGSKTDVSKHASCKTQQSCSSCSLFQGKTGDASAPCTIFANKLVSGKG
jgi:hypothetical protein